MRKPRCRTALATVALIAASSSLQSAHAALPVAAASSEWGPGYGAEQASDGVADENGNYWQTVQNADKGAWWRLDLGGVFAVQAVKAAWARYEDSVHCPPVSVVIQTSLTAADGSWQDARRIGADELPRDGQPYDAARAWRYTLPQPTRARYVRLLFPDGSQPGARYPGYLCLGEIIVEAPGLGPRLVAIEGRFGKAVVDVNSPRLLELHLAGPNGPTPQSILALSGPRPWANGAYTYVVGTDGKRYESRQGPPDTVQVALEAGRTAVRLKGVKLAAGSSREVVAVEDWTLSSPGDGSRLVWEVTRKWTKDVPVSLSGSPGLFFSFDARRTRNSVTSTIWYDPLRIIARTDPMYALIRLPGRVSENHLQTIRDRDTWAIYKLWTNWHAPSDLRLDVTGGHLYRRGSFAWLSEAGAVTSPDAVQSHKAGQVERVMLNISPVEKTTTGYQLSVGLPDKQTERALRDFYGSVLNGGAINDQKGFDFGNESDGWYYAGSCWMYGLALAAGVPAPGELSSRPYDAASAFREHLVHVLSVLDDKGRAHFGYNQGGEWVDDNLHTIIGTRAYVVHSGDVALVRQVLPALERMLKYFVQRRNEQGLFRLEDVGAHWYYDAISTGGVNGYYNAFFYKATCDLAEMEEAVGRDQKAGEYRALADSIKRAFNQVLWREDLPGGPRYLDWIDATGREVSYFCDLCQWPAVAVGVASPEQARKIVATADARIRTLETEQGYRGVAGLSALWPVSKDLNPLDWQTFGTYMNGGSLLAQTYWEIVGRARAGDAEGAARRLKLFARRAQETSWAGDNAANIRGEMAGGDGEPYLADMVVATAAAVNGVLGITPTWERLTVRPALPADWPRAEADVLYRGRRHHLVIEGATARVEVREQVLRTQLQWVVDANWRSTPGGRATMSDIDCGDGSAIALQRVYDDRGALGIWKLDEASGPVLDASPHQSHGDVSGEGVTRGEPGHGTGSKGYGFDGRGTVIVWNAGGFTFGLTESFTVQCWFRTDAQDSRVMLGKPGAYCVYVKQGKLAAWLMQDGAQYREALGSRLVADGQWHHVAAVYDRQAQRLSLYADGKLDTADGSAGPQNPVDISSLGPSTGSAPATLGGLGEGFQFLGWLDEVSVLRGALKPPEFGLDRDYPSPYGSQKVAYTASGTYVSPPCDWGVPGKPGDLAVAADLNGGRVAVCVETSGDGFTTVQSRARFALLDGVRAYPLSIRKAAQAIRVWFRLTPAPGAAATPVVDGFRLTGTQVNEGP